VGNAPDATESVENVATFQDEENTFVSLPLHDVPLPNYTNPWSNQTPVGILERWYQLSPVTYTTSTPYQYLVRNCNPVFNNDAWSQATKSFRWFRFKQIEYRVQYSSIPMMYGFSWLTCLPAVISNYTMDTTVAEQWASHVDTVMLDFSQQQDVTMVAPWIFPDQWIDLYGVFGGTAITDALEQGCSLKFVNPVSPVKVLDSTVSTSVELQVFCRFVGVELAGHVDNNTQPSASVARFESQSKSSGFASTLLGSATLLGMLGMPNRGFDLSGAGVVNDVVNVVNTVSAVKEVVSAAKTALAPSGETDPDSKELKPNLYGSLVASSPKYVLGTGTLMSVTRKWGIREYMSIPSLWSYGILITDGTKVRVSANVMAYSGEYGRVQYLSQFFRMWRGSMNFTFVFFASPFISARVNIVVGFEPNGNYVGTLGNELIKDVTIRGTTRVDVNVPYLAADTWLPTVWQFEVADSRLSQVDFIYTLGYKTIQAPQSVGDVTPVIPYVVYFSPGPDFEFRSLVNPSPFLVPEMEKSKFESQMMVSSFCRPEIIDSGSLPRMPYASDSEDSLDSMLRRWSYRAPNKGALNWPVTNGLGVFDNVAKLFGFYSGQMCFKAVVSDSSVGNVVALRMQNFLSQTADANYGVPATKRVEDGMNMISSYFTQVIEGTAPFLSTVNFWPISPSPYTGGRDYFNVGSFRYFWRSDLEQDNLSVVADTLLVSAGPDFSLYYPLPPPRVAAVVWPSYGHRHVGEAPLMKRPLDSSSGKSESSYESCSLSDEVPVCKKTCGFIKL
jgi:hypothetical protein